MNYEEYIAKRREDPEYRKVERRLKLILDIKDIVFRLRRWLRRKQMGDRYIISVQCPRCAFTDDDVWFAPTCDAVDWNCPKCQEYVDLVELTGITFEDASNREEIEALCQERLAQTGKQIP